jgi:hypothetical protein
MGSLRLSLLAGLLSISACDTPLVCDTSIRPSIVVIVLDSITGLPAADSAQALVRDGAFADTLVPYGYDPPGTLRSLAMRGERPGIYTVSVLRPGYNPWQRASVQVRGATCHTTQVTLTASLQRAP